MTDELSQYISHHLQFQQDEVLESFISQIKNTFKNTIVGIVFYGSCMRSREYKDAMLDFYVVVDDYSHAYTNYWYRYANYLLSPNVFFIKTNVNGQSYQAKYAVMSKNGLHAGVSRAFHSYFWARFTQPMSCIYARDNDFKQWFLSIQCAAARSFCLAVLPSIKNEITSETFWVQGLQLTYAAELRAETKTRATHIYQSDHEFYDGVFLGLHIENYTDQESPLINKIKWKIRITYGKVLSVLRLMKATTTFVGGVDYIAWKIERHTGEQVVVSRNMRKYPWIFCWPVIMRLLRQGKIR